MVEGGLILSCLIPAFHFADGTWPAITVSGLFTFNVGLFLTVSYHEARRITDKRMAYLLAPREPPSFRPWNGCPPPSCFGGA